MSDKKDIAVQHVITCHPNQQGEKLLVHAAGIEFMM
jgi:hypothetical protein